MSREAMKLALEALVQLDGIDTETECVTIDVDDVITALRQALETEQEPVATVTSESGNPNLSMSWWHEPALPVGTKIYTSPPKREWVGLTDDDVSYFQYQATFCDEFDAAFMAELIEKDLKEKNHG